MQLVVFIDEKFGDLVKLLTNLIVYYGEYWVLLQFLVVLLILNV